MQITSMWAEPKRSALGQSGRMYDRADVLTLLWCLGDGCDGGWSSDVSRVGRRPGPGSSPSPPRGPALVPGGGRPLAVRARRRPDQLVRASSSAAGRRQSRRRLLDCRRAHCAPPSRPVCPRRTTGEQGFIQPHPRVVNSTLGKYPSP